MLFWIAFSATIQLCHFKMTKKSWNKEFTSLFVQHNQSPDPSIFTLRRRKKTLTLTNRTRWRCWLLAVFCWWYMKTRTAQTPDSSNILDLHCPTRLCDWITTPELFSNSMQTTLHYVSLKTQKSNRLAIKSWMSLMVPPLNIFRFSFKSMWNVVLCRAPRPLRNIHSHTMRA